MTFQNKSSITLVYFARHIQTQNLFLNRENVSQFAPQGFNRASFFFFPLRQKGVGSVTVPAPRCAVQHEGEKHQEGSDAHPQNQPEPRAPREKSKWLLFVSLCPLLINF